VMNKVPGLKFQVQQMRMDLLYSDKFKNEGKPLPGAYERLLLEATGGDHSHFVSAQELDASWRIFTPLLKRLAAEKIKPHPYPYGSRGPAAADALAQRYGLTKFGGGITGYVQGRPAKNMAGGDSPSPVPSQAAAAAASAGGGGGGGGGSSRLVQPPSLHQPSSQRRPSSSSSSAAAGECLAQAAAASMLSARAELGGSAAAPAPPRGGAVGSATPPARTAPPSSSQPLPAADISDATSAAASAATPTPSDLPHASPGDEHPPRSRAAPLSLQAKLEAAEEAPHARSPESVPPSPASQPPSMAASVPGASSR
jgi:hypothetical protein